MLWPVARLNAISIQAARARCLGVLSFIVSLVLIRNQETGLSLRSAPNFGPGGAWPPLVTDWLPVRYELFDASQHDLGAMVAYRAIQQAFFDPYLSEFEPAHPLFKEDGLREDFLFGSLFGDYPEDARLSVSLSRKNGKIKHIRIDFPAKGTGSPSKSEFLQSVFESELRRVVHSVRWRRTNPVTQLPPGASNVMTDTITTGLSIEYSQTLASSLGISIGSGLHGVAQANLSSQLQQQFGITLQITSQEQTSGQLTVPNPSVDRSRLFAFWHVDNRIDVDFLTIGPQVGRGPAPDSPAVAHFALRPTWTPLSSVEFATKSAPHVTFTDVHPADS
jgi:hypothetical protein